MPYDDWLHCRCYRRRTILGLALAPLLLADPARTAEEGEGAKPLALDDRFVFLTGPKKGQVVRAEDLAVGGAQVQAYPMAPDGTVRSDSRLNLVILARFDPAELTEETRALAAEGVVAYSGNELKGYGNLILVRHANGYVTAYAHASELLVKRGDTIKRGQIIAKSGQSGEVGSPQLHFEIRKGSTPVDPLQFLNGA